MRELGGDIDHYLERAAGAVEFDAASFETCRDGSFESELQSQYSVYVYGAAVSRVLRSNGIHVDYAAGYSMGLYASLHHAGSIDFETGLAMIDHAYRAIESASEGREFGTGAVSGLTRGDLLAIIGAGSDVEIVNENSEHGFLVSGLLEGVMALLDRAREEGALHARLLPFGSPYHSKFMDGAARKFEAGLSGFVIGKPGCPLVSTIDHRLVTTAGEVRRDIIDNIHHGINWHHAVKTMIAFGVDTFIECGPGRSLCRMLRFIDPGVSAFNLQNIHSFLGAGNASRARALSR